MRNNIRELLVGLGCKSVPAERTPRSFGAGFLRVKRIERYRAKREAAEALRAESEDGWQATRRAIDIARLRQLGGVKRSQDEELEFLGLLVRHNCSKAYFESRAWERRAS